MQDARRYDYEDNENRELCMPVVYLCSLIVCAAGLVFVIYILWPLQ